MFFCETVETILECGYHGRDLPNDLYIREEADRFVEEGYMELADGGYRLTEFGTEILRDWFQLEYEKSLFNSLPMEEPPYTRSKALWRDL